jgi:DNA-binding LacI/PurR family transcriptional regulator
MVTMSDVAKAAGVSRATASYALRGDPRIISTTAQRVIKVAKDLNYTTNLSARSLRSGKSGVIGVAIYELDKPYPSEMSAEVSREASRNGLQAIIQQTSNSKEGEISILKNVTSQLCDGTIFSPGIVTNEEIRELSGGKPIILLDDTSQDSLFDGVYTPGRDGSRSAILHLMAQGCKNIFIIGADYESLSKKGSLIPVSSQRLKGCQDAFAQQGLTLQSGQVLRTDEWTPAAARKAVHELVNSDKVFDGIFCMTDSLALGALRGLEDCGLTVPGDVAVMGFDGINEGELSIPSLSTIKIDLKDLAEKAVSLLLKRIKEPSQPFTPRRLTAAYTLVQRESTSREKNTHQ